MSYQVFARKYRPQTFSDVLGQDHVVQTLRNAIEQKRLAHAYLFVGPRGTGKTSIARIFAKALNAPNGPSIEFDPQTTISQEIAEGRSLDVLEIDGASNNGVEQVRDLRDKVQYAPAQCSFKIIYIDEVHMLSNAAFNALLKTLEEPPPHVKFIFATTEPHKILATIISRCQRFDLRPISTPIIAQQLLHIASQEKIMLEDSAAWAIAKGADGGMRDAQSMLDQLVAFCGQDIKEQQVLDIFGFTSQQTIYQLLQCLLTKQTATALELIYEQERLGKNLAQFLAELIEVFRHLIVSKIDPHKALNLQKNAGSEFNQLLTLIEPINLERLLHIIDLFAQADRQMKWASNKRLHLEMALIRAIHSLDEVLIDDIIKALNKAPEQLISESITSPDSKAPLPSEAPEQPILSPPPSPLPSDPENQPSPLQSTPINSVQDESSTKNDAPLSSEGSIFDNLRAMAVEERPPEPEPSSPPNSPPAPESSAHSSPSTSPESNSSPSPQESAERFYQDELIQAALAQFEAKIVPS